ncbi:hypothetical protein [Paenibacillus xylaniclasticus]|uniref:hypothetical protein n=1 Tax=Paenibacillus xylaniclasticus TaxID=588083 RepID=UPI000FDB75E4|nr:MULTISPECIES: hypothetical protein [Paenibacillus]GFN32338.1 hypothetical protein PCURB6_25980 [Paenibacillus curdlanolyticus]
MSANSALILTQAEVRNIKRYVQQKFSDLPQDKHADIVADAVRRIVFKRLPEFADDVRQRLTTDLIRTALVERAGPVRTDDIVEACLRLELQDDSLFGPFHTWVEQQLNATVQPDSLREAIRDAHAGMKESSGEYAAWPSMAEQLMKAAAPLESMSEGQAVVLPFTRPDPVAEDDSDVKSEALDTGHPAGRNRRWIVYGLLSTVLVAATLMYGWSLTQSEEAVPAPAEVTEISEPQLSLNELPEELQYHEVDRKRLAQYLNGKNSLLSEPEHMESIFDAAKQFDIDPILLFAITGQEQAFVPRSHKRANEIINNPFNVFHSWQEYNTTLHKSAEIAARTIARLSKNRPTGTDPFTWINREYAEDPHWSDGVRSIWKTITKYVHVQ